VLLVFEWSRRVKCVVLWVSRILSTVCRGIFEDCRSDHGVAEEKQEVCLDREMRRSV
jgi:hypothetical protein